MRKLLFVVVVSLSVLSFANAQKKAYSAKVLDSLAIKSAEHNNYGEALGYFYIKNELFGDSLSSKLMEVQTISFMLNDYGNISKKPKTVLTAFVEMLTNLLPQYKEYNDVATIRWVRAKTNFALIYYFVFFDKMEENEFNARKALILEDLDYCYENLPNSYKSDIEMMKKKTVNRDVKKLKFR